MAWDNPGGGVITFECDSCTAVEECDTEKVKLGVAGPLHKLVTDFTMCWSYLEGLGWKSFKRTGHPWSYHCLKCSEEAERQHREWLRHDHERERAKARNAL